MYFHTYASPIGELTLVGMGRVLTALYFANERARVLRNFAPDTGQNVPVFDQACRWLDSYFARKKAQDMPALAPQGTDFQQRVWAQLLRIRYGEVVSYGSVSCAVAAARGVARMAAQAVGSAVGKNPVGIIIPCHRVIGSDGALRGFGGGIEVKEWLLRHEGHKIVAGRVLL